jgi:NTP pyrophosphatase (non-canonical NTP hydrolase)
VNATPAPVEVKVGQLWEAYEPGYNTRTLQVLELVSRNQYGGTEPSARCHVVETGRKVVVALRRLLKPGKTRGYRLVSEDAAVSHIDPPSTPAPAPPLTVAELQRESYDTACAKGWHDEDRGPVSPAVHEIALAGLRIASICDDIEAVRKGVDPQKARRSMMLAGVNHWQARALCWLALVCTEAAEAMDDVLAERWTTTMREDGKPEGIGSELADIIIRVCDTAGALGLDMEAELRAKLAYNRTRSHKHGGKLA